MAGSTSTTSSRVTASTPLITSSVARGERAAPAPERKFPATPATPYTSNSVPIMPALAPETSSSTGRTYVYAVKWPVTRNATRTSPARTRALPSRRSTPPSGTACSAGSGGSSTASARRASTAAATKAARQPASSPTCAPAGIPSTEAMATPLKTSDVAVGTDVAGTSRTASPAAIAQTPPMPTPTSTRATTMTSKPGAQAAARLPTASTARRAQSTSLRSLRPNRAVSKGEETAATSPVTVSVDPASPSETRKEAPIGVSRPTGSISDVTTAKVLTARATTAAHPRTVPLLTASSRRPACSAPRSATYRACSLSMPTSQLTAGGRNNGELLILL